MASTANMGEASLTASAAQAIAPELFPARTPITRTQVEAGINVCLGIQRRAVNFGKRPFAACLLGPDNETVLLMHQSVDQVNHAESSLARLAYCHYSKDYLWRCTLVSTWEPCAMCSGMPSLLWDETNILANITYVSNYILGTHRPCNIRCYQ